MQAAYVDKYEEELRIAKEKAERIEGPMEICVPYLRYVGATKVGESITHYYFAESTGKYYYESEFAKQMRIRNRQRRLERYAKKIAHPLAVNVPSDLSHRCKNILRK